MPQGANQVVVLLPIHPIFAKRILDGTKKVEFRRIAFRREVQFVLLYSTSPESEIVGKFEVDHMETNTPEKLWNIYQDKAGITKDMYDEYFLGCDKGTAIQIKKAIRFKRPIQLSELSPDAYPPRGFRYIPESWISAANLRVDYVQQRK